MKNHRCHPTNSITDKLPAKDDMQNMVYCVATIQEIQRLSTVAMGGLQHVLMKDTTVKGYHFPKGTCTNNNLL